MNALAAQTQAPPIDHSKDLAIVTESLTAIEKIEAGIAELAIKTKGVVFDVKTAPGMALAIAARASVRDPRYAVERARKAAKAPILQMGKDIEATAARITAQLLELETPIDLQIQNEQARKDLEKAEKAKAEQARVAKIQDNISEIRGRPMLMLGYPAFDILQTLERMRALPPASPGFYEEFVEQAESTKAGAIAALEGMHAAAVKHEAEQEQLRLEKLELAQLRETDAKRREEQALADAESKRLADEIIERQNAERIAADAAAKAERDKANKQAADERAEADRLAQVERDRLAEIAEKEAAEQRGRDQAAAAAERDRLAAERAQIQADAAAAEARELALIVDKLTLIDAAQDAHAHLVRMGEGTAAPTVKLGMVLARELAVTA